MTSEPCFLVLENGDVFKGRQLGHRGRVVGEMAVSTAMTGYAESLSDPSYRGQILVFTYPQIGNYGISSQELESDRIQAAGLVVAEGHNPGSHYSSRINLDAWLDEQGIVGISGVDTRRLIQSLRGQGAVWGRISCDGSPFNSEEKCHPICHLEEVSTSRVVVHGEGRLRIGLLDCGVKRSIIAVLVGQGISILQLPFDTDLSGIDVDGWVISNGPGDPRDYPLIIDQIRHVLKESRPIFGICLGHQLMALAAGARVEPMAFGHRGHNQPVHEVGGERGFITSQNHGYAVAADSLPEGWIPWFENLNDRSNEGIRHREKPFASVQFHPEACGGPRDTGFLFNRFVEQVKGSRK